MEKTLSEKNWTTQVKQARKVLFKTVTVWESLNLTPLRAGDFLRAGVGCGEYRPPEFANWPCP